MAGIPRPGKPATGTSKGKAQLPNYGASDKTMRNQQSANLAKGKGATGKAMQGQPSGNHGSSMKGSAPMTGAPDRTMRNQQNANGAMQASQGIPTKLGPEERMRRLGTSLRGR